MAAIKFDLAPIADSEKGAVKQENVGGLYENLPFNQLPDELRFSPMGGIPPVFRSGIVRVALAKLAIAGVIAALAAIQATNSDAAFSCTLAAAVNFVACAHYWFILKIREQNLPHAFWPFSSGRNTAGEWVGRKETTNEDAKLFAQEFYVDGLRYTDWTATLPFMVLDLLDLAYHATGGVEPNFDKYWAAALMPVMVFFGGCFRFYANQLRGKEFATKEEATKGNIDCPQIFVGGASLIISCVIFGIVVSNIINPIVDEMCPPGATPNSDDKCPITDINKKHDSQAVLILTLVWIGYPLVATLSAFSLPAQGFPTGFRGAFVSTSKDAAYAVLDVVSKSGLALYVSYRTTWV